MEPDPVVLAQALLRQAETSSNPGPLLAAVRALLDEAQARSDRTGS